MVGGFYNTDNRETSGPIAVAQLQKFRANFAVLTVGAVSAKAGIMDFSIEEAHIACTMISQSEKLIVLADHSKLDRIAPFEVAKLKQVDSLICDQQPSKELIQELKQESIDLMIAH